MKSTKHASILILFLTLLAGPASPCSLFTAHDTDTVLTGNNEDGPRDWTVVIWFEPPADGRYGYVGFRYTNTGIQGGMNDQGLFWDGLAAPPHELEIDTGTIPFTGNTFIEMLRQAATVDEAIAFLRLHRLSEAFEEGQLFFADRSGDSAVLEGDAVIEPTESYQICTNFYHSHPELGNYPCWRYEAIQAMMESGLELTVDYFFAMAEAAHQGTDTDSSVYTRYTTVCDLVAIQCTVTYDLDFEHRVVIDLEDELALGRHEIMMADLFYPPPEVEEEPEPVMEEEPEAAEEISQEEVEEEAATEPVPDSAADPDVVPADPVSEEEAFPTEVCEGCGCRMTGSSGMEKTAMLWSLVLVLAGLLVTGRKSRKGLKVGFFALVMGIILAAGCGENCHTVWDAGTDPLPDQEVDAVQDADMEGVQDPVAEEAQDPDMAEEDVDTEEIEEEGLAFIVQVPAGTDDEWVPLQGATVALDAPFSDRAEKLTNEAGRVVFGGLEWTEAMATVSAHKNGYTMVSLLNMNADRIDEVEHVDGAVALRISELDQETPEPVTVSGTATGLVDTSHPYLVGVVNSSTTLSYITEWSGASTATFSMTLQQGRPFTLQGVETEVVDSTSTRGYSQNIFRVMQKEFEAIDEDLDGVVLDFAADEVSVTRADIAVPMPTRADSPLRSGVADCVVAAEDSYSSIGWAVDLDFDADLDQMDMSFAWTRPAWAEHVQTYCWVYSEEWFSYNFFGWDGYPGDVDPDLAFDAPDWVFPSSPLLSVPLHSNLRWTLFDSGVEVVFAVSRPGQYLWEVSPGRDATRLTLPEPPSSVDGNAFFGRALLNGELRVGLWDESSGRWLRWSQPQSMLLEPPL